MTQKKKARTRTTTSFFTNDIMPVITEQSNDETDKSALAISHLSFGTSQYQTNRLLAKLAQFAKEGKIAQVAKLSTIRPDLRIEVLFTLAGLGAQDEMEKILKEHPEDLLVSHRLRDISGAEFPSVTLLQHAIWTKDVRYMANMFLDCLPKNEQGETIRVALEQQAKIHMDKGVVYQLNGARCSEVHFNIQPLLTELNTHVRNYGNWKEDKQRSHWYTKVGLEQTRVPAIIRHHYCDPEESFWNKPDFKKPKLKRSLTIFNWFEMNLQLWSESLIGLGTYFGIFAVPRKQAIGGMAQNFATDLVALTALDEVRTKTDMPKLIKRLQTPIQSLEDDLDLETEYFRLEKKS